ncbi:response regulator transcription factor [Kytococcus sedentarius]|uniref:Response regulator containing a CheY-like receiver domain and an HTH DNA-binding domain n=1 Tax=Kytococcus sedentarius (strain ATCC 14392 / DSM 20547 / JCM 11482 / CCUG 33030 / NBRC 15357 / NCTC 11040 / CCM 314 / 541) TaxID=478801 RepID=C7NEV7_KYTSD|nr:response regulator transcription factor [Kytococcus sedentarius]ACV05781.1 response regulator containing a CheY-like receiver domain and an HTH DNA-binding domain [Kytococcus sedentarius DSM 20547]QQB64187.1 response regulator transcription factor [Kytococcus sedentarius]STX12805.1 Nitrogen regulation protein C [Kytococcus sedentarius]
MSARLVVADDSAILREGLVGLLERRGYEVVAQVSRADDLADRVRELAAAGALPDGVVTDARMPPTMTDDGIRVAADLKEQFPELSVLVVSQYVVPVHAQRLFGLHGSGGAGYLLKDRVAQVEDFVASLEIILSGGVVTGPEVTRAMMRTGASGLGELTPREREVLELMARGLSNAEIASELFLSVAAVAKHVSNIFAKLHLAPGEENRRVRAILQYLAERGDAPAW